mgnify:CR=1 FL=1
MDKIEEAVFELLDDNEEHSLDEIRKYIAEKSPELLQNKNYLSVILCRLVKEKKLTRTDKRGGYKMLQNNMVQVVKDGQGDLRQKVLADWKNYYSDIERKYKLSYEMTEEQFKAAKWLHGLSQEVMDLIKKF